MGLFASFKIGEQALRANTFALQTIGHNIANANTEGYTRQRVETAANQPVNLGSFTVGTGVRIQKVRRLVDETLETSIEKHKASLGDLRRQTEALDQLESILGRLSGSNLSSSLDRFFKAVGDLSTSPEDLSSRTALIGSGRELADQISFIANRILGIRAATDQLIEKTVDRADDITSQIADLNAQIVRDEAGGINPSAANDLRDRRGQLLKELAELVEIDTAENPVGSVDVRVGSHPIVLGATRFELSTRTRTDRGVVVHDVQFKDSGNLVTLEGGELKGMVAARDTILTQFHDQLRDFARSLVFEVNKVHSEGRGLTRFRALDSDFAVATSQRTTVPLNSTGTVTSSDARDRFRSTQLTGKGNDFFNGLKVRFTSGLNAGLERTVSDYDSGTGEFFLDAALDDAIGVGDAFEVTGLPYGPTNGTFEFTVTTEGTGVQKTLVVPVDLDGIGADASLETVRSALQTAVTSAFGSAVVTASITTDNRLRLTASSGFTFSFGADSSNLLAAMGINSFFTGDDALTIAVSDNVGLDASKVAAARSNDAGDNRNATALAGVKDSRTLAAGTTTLEDFLQGILSDLGVQAGSKRELADTEDDILTNLLNQREQISGVNLDEEAVSLIAFQRAFQASARYIAVVNATLDELVNIL